MSDETIIWKGTASQWKNFWWFAACLLVLPIPFAFWKWLKTRSQVYTLTSERLLIEQGVFNKTHDTLELYRVRDLQVTEPFWQRLVGLQNIQLLATDLTTESLSLDYLPAKLNLRDEFRKHIEECRRRKGVREIGVDLEPGADSPR
jgi:uncharacterized membrane protein YdbT with pleckstrin-like domain